MSFGSTKPPKWERCFQVTFGVTTVFVFLAAIMVFIPWEIECYADSDCMPVPSTGIAHCRDYKCGCGYMNWRCVHNSRPTVYIVFDFIFVTALCIWSLVCLFGVSQVEVP
jgi:hypothetical protein